MSLLPPELWKMIWDYHRRNIRELAAEQKTEINDFIKNNVETSMNAKRPHCCTGDLSIYWLEHKDDMWTKICTFLYMENDRLYVTFLKYMPHLIEKDDDIFDCDITSYELVGTNQTFVPENFSKVKMF